MELHRLYVWIGIRNIDKSKTLVLLKWWNELLGFKISVGTKIFVHACMIMTCIFYSNYIFRIHTQDM